MARLVSLSPHPDAPEARKRLRQKAKTVVQWTGIVGGLAAATFALVCVVIVLMLTWQMWPQSHLHDWPKFYQSEVSQRFKIPPSAKIVHAVDKPDIMGQEVCIRFRLPETKTPSAWVEHIATSSGIPVRYREDPLHYDGPGDYNLVSYDPQTRLYEVMYGWD